jgi:hypothetical protein
LVAGPLLIVSLDEEESGGEHSEVPQHFENAVKGQSEGKEKNRKNVRARDR